MSGPGGKFVFVDALVEEVRQRRRDLLASCGNDLEALARLLRRHEAEHPERVADPRTRAIAPCKGAHLRRESFEQGQAPDARRFHQPLGNAQGYREQGHPEEEHGGHGQAQVVEEDRLDDPDDRRPEHGP